MWLSRVLARLTYRSHGLMKKLGTPFLTGEWRSGTFYEISKMCGWEANKEALKQRRGTDFFAVSVGPQASKFHHV